MRKLMTAAFALSALFAASAKVQAEVNYPWCLMGDTRGYECVFSSREQCMQDGRNRGFGGQCVQNPAYKPGRPPTVSGPVNKRTPSLTAYPSQAVSAAHSTCTGLKLACLGSVDRGRIAWLGSCLFLGGFTPAPAPYCENHCNFVWEQCMKTGFWDGSLIHRPAERRGVGGER
jgi:hypothetical protein